jgi:hypothetical protein
MVLTLWMTSPPPPPPHLLFPVSARKSKRACKFFGLDVVGGGGEAGLVAGERLGSERVCGGVGVGSYCKKHRPSRGKGHLLLVRLVFC